MQRQDPLTGELFYPRRSNQKFASRANQIRFNNNKAEEKRKAKSEADRYLDRNRSILINVLGNEETVIKNKDFLLGAGFNFRCHTHSIPREKGIWVCIYDYAFMNIGNNQYKIFKHV